MEIYLTPIAFAKNSRSTPIDDNWNQIVSEIELADHISAEAILNLSDFSHLESFSISTKWMITTSFILVIQEATKLTR